MAPTTRCLRYLSLATDVLFMVLGVSAAVLVLVLVLPLVSLLSLPRWLLPPLLLPLLPALLAVPLGFVALAVTRNATARRWRLVGVSTLQMLFAGALAVLAGWQVFLSFSPRLETDFTALINESLHDPKWDTVYQELRCCGTAGPASASFRGSSGIPQACCTRDGPAGAAGAAAGQCAHLYTQGCVAPAADRVRAVLKDGAAVHGGAALLMFLCALSTAFYADALKRERRKRKELQEGKEEKPLRSPVLNRKF